MSDAPVKFTLDGIPSVEEVMEKCSGLLLIEDWLAQWGRQHPLSAKDQAIINTYEAVDLLKTALYESQGRRKRNKEMFYTEVGDLIVMAMMKAVRENVNLFEVIKLAMQRLENVEFKKSGAKTR